MAYGEMQTPAVETLPVCARHPDRVTYVSCQRCGQPVCPECMRPAAVGVQCVSCVNQGAKMVASTQRNYRLANRNSVGAAAIAKPTVTYTIVGLCAAMFLLQLAMGNAWTNRFAFTPAIGAIEPWRFITAAFLHSTGFMGHILFNMMAFWQCGNLLERALGHARFAALCLVTAVAGSVAFLLLAGGPTGASWNTPVVGASGMVFGLFGALVPIMQKATGSARQIWSLLAINAVLGFIIPGIAWQAHLGGFLVGMGMSWVYTHFGPSLKTVNARKALAWTLPIALVAFLTAAAILNYHLTGWLSLISQLR